jgi:hypothetical protein
VSTVPPIFVVVDDLLVFDSIEAAESYLEPVDVTEGERAYDSQGRLFRVRVEGSIKRGWFSVDQSRATVKLDPTETQPGHAEQLRVALGRWLGQLESSGPRQCPPRRPRAPLAEIFGKIHGAPPQNEQ